MPKLAKKSKPNEEILVESDMEDINKTVNVEFEAFPPDESDYHGVRTLLAQLLRGLDVDPGAFADIVITQSNVGSVVKQLESSDEEDDDCMDDDQDDVHGVTSIINLTKRKKEPQIESLTSALLSKCKQNCPISKYDQVSKILNDENQQIGLLISERLINLPALLSLPCYRSLLEELSKACMGDKSFKFCHIIMICKTFRNEVSKKKKKKEIRNQNGEILYSNPEEEVFFEESLLSFDYPLKESVGMPQTHEEGESGNSLVAHRNVIIFKGDQFKNIVDKVEKAIHNVS